MVAASRRLKRTRVHALRTILPPLACCCLLVAVANAEGGGGNRANNAKIYDIKEISEQEQQQQFNNDVCGVDTEANHVGKLYLEFNVPEQQQQSTTTTNKALSWTEDDVVALQNLLADAYADASTENCQEGYRFLQNIDIDRENSSASAMPSSSTEYGKQQYRVDVNVMQQCRGCSQDLRFFSSTTEGRSKGRFLQDVGQRQQIGMFGGISNNRNQDGDNKNSKRGQEVFLQQDQACRCPPPSRDRVLDGLRSRLDAEKEEGRLATVPELASIGAYFSGLQQQTRQSSATIMKQKRVSRPESTNATDKVMDMTCSEQPPFSEPFDLPDIPPFQALSSCPFVSHELALGEDVGTCFPAYDIPHWYSHEYSVSFMLRQVKVGNTLFFEKESVFATWDDLIDIISMDDFIGTKSCLQSLDISAVGVHGEVSGEAGTAKTSVVVVSFAEQGKERYILLPIGGCEDAVYGVLRSDKQRYLDEYAAAEASTKCDMLADQETNNEIGGECLQQCNADATSKYHSKVNELERHRDEMLSINFTNEKAVMDKLFLTRASDMVLGFAKCQCSGTTDVLEQCLLEVFVEAVATETDQWFEALEIFGQHRQGVERQFVEQKQLACDAADEGRDTCQQRC